ncbi:hypothetical protein AKJ63_00045 [candidate division MSBL1 archaeon SCGC-AAA259D18]|uniref:Acetylornithine transaminase n=2 Tax=candidate division MSBL1 TaxID=215777 RepID=A0A133UAW0_9EURY|nr:hypothetical protein AKJ57_01640 [candidate division MSBL1 archaeon SCGC-AAA259A05]KXA92012.1 hypothetical protein AKJ63_00045 [candidate division MSBL1 archaeon SCGC-AAA259D18]
MNIFELEEKYIAPTYGRQPLTFVEGDGMKLEDSEGNEYLDFVAGIAVCSLGHCHPAISRALTEQAKKLVHVSNLYHIPTQAEFGEKLAEVTPESIQKFFFCNSGAEAVESALKLAVEHTGREKIVALEESFHGRTSASVGITWKKAYREPFKALISDAFEFIPKGDLVKAEEKIDEKTAAVIAEPVQGEGGVKVLPEDFLPGLRELCDENDVLLILDEIQAGLCRTGKWFACDHWGVEPDILTMAKALGNGFPIGSMGARSEVMDTFSPGDHASTFGGSPLACAVGKAVIETMQSENMPAHVERVGRYFKNKLQDLAERYKMVQEVRGLGLMLAMELDDEEDAKDVHARVQGDGFLINRTAGEVLRFVPPLIVQENHVDQLIEELDQVLDEVE